MTPLPNVVYTIIDVSIEQIPVEDKSADAFAARYTQTNQVFAIRRNTPLEQEK